MKRSTKVLLAVGAAVALVLAALLTLGSSSRAMAASGIAAHVPLVGDIGCQAQADVALEVQKQHCLERADCYWNEEFAQLYRKQLARAICAQAGNR